MVRLHKISKTFGVIVCILSLMGIYIVQTVCLAENVTLTNEISNVENHHHKSHNEHHNHSAGNTDDCCSSVAANYFTSFQGIPSNTTNTAIAITHLLPVGISQIFHIYNNSNPIPESNNEGPPLTIHSSGAAKRIIIQSFQI